jgi:quercetin dioxygenase-like cupin family protein
VSAVVNAEDPEQQWRIVDPIFDARTPLHVYEPGTRGLRRRIAWSRPGGGSRRSNRSRGEGIMIMTKDDATEQRNVKTTLVYQHELPNVPGKSVKSVLVEYGPGGYSPGHTHAKSAFIYATVLEGAIRSQINDGPVTTYNAGQSWAELPGDRHGVSANASETKPAKIVAVFVVDTDEKELTTPFGN